MRREVRGARREGVPGRCAVALTLILGLDGCGFVDLKTPAPAVTTYVLEPALPPDAGAAPRGARVLLVDKPEARAALDTPRIAYLRRDYAFEYFTQSAWVESPARMLAPLLARALERQGGFEAVASAPSAVAAELRLATEVLDFTHDFRTQPSRVRIALRVQLIDAGSRALLATRVFEAEEPAASDDAYGGVQAFNRAAARLLPEIAAFAARAAAQPGKTNGGMDRA